MTENNRVTGRTQYTSRLGPGGNQQISQQVLSQSNMRISSNQGISSNSIQSSSYRFGSGDQRVENFSSSTVQQGLSGRQLHGTRGGQRTGLSGGEQDNELEWTGRKQTVISGETDFATLKHTKDILTELISQFDVNSKLIFEGEYKDNINKRLLLLENDLEGTMKRMVVASNHNMPTGHRLMDYNQLLNSKQSDLIGKETKIQNMEERLRIAQQNQIRYKIQVEGLNKTITEKNRLIHELQNSLNNKDSSHKVGSSSKNDGLKTYLSNLERQINRLKGKQLSVEELEGTVQKWILSLPAESPLRGTFQTGELRRREDETYHDMNGKFSIAAELYRKQIDKIRRQNPNMRISIEEGLIDVLRANNTKVLSLNGGLVQVEKQVRITQEVPVQDSRTKHLIHALSVHLKKLHEKYPKLRAEMDEKLSEFISYEIIEMMQVDEIDRIVDIVKYVPQVVKVENVYAYSSEKNRKVQFHLRVLIKALLEEMEKVKAQKGVVFELDEGVIAMIRAEIMDLVDIDDLLKVYRPVPKIVQVQKIVEKVVDNIVRVPEKYEINRHSTNTLGLQKPSFAKDEKALILSQERGVPLVHEKAVAMRNHQEKIVAYPEVKERTAVDEYFKTQMQPEIQIVEKIVEVEKPIDIVRQKVVIQEKLIPHEIIKQVVKYIEIEKEVIKPVEVFIEKIVDRIVEVEKIVMVPEIREKVIEVPVYKTIQKDKVIWEPKIEVVTQEKQILVPVKETIEVLKIQTQLVEKIVTVQKRVQLPPKEIIVNIEKMCVQKEIEIVEVSVPHVITEKVIEIRQVQKVVQVPVRIPQIKVEKEIHQVPFFQKIEKLTHVPVVIEKPIIIREEQTIEVTKNVPHIMVEQIPVPFKEVEIRPFEIHCEVIKEVPTIKERIIEKLVEVPKVVQVEKIVEKIVTVPRIIQKIVEVPKIIEVIVQRIIEKPIEMPPIERIVEKPCRVQVPIEVIKQKIVYTTVQKPVHVPAEQILVKDLDERSNEVPRDLIQERVRVHKEEVPVDIYKDKIVQKIEQVHVVEYIDRTLVKPVEVPVPIYLEKQIPVYMNTETIKVQPEVQTIEKVIPLLRETENLVTKTQVQQKIVVQEKPVVEEVRTPFPVTDLRVEKEVVERIVEVRTNTERIKEVPYAVEKIVENYYEKAKIYEIEKTAQVVIPPPQIQIVEQIVPRIINVNKYIQKIADKLVRIPYLLRQKEVINNQVEKMVQGASNTSHTAQTVDLMVEKELIRQKEKIMTEQVVMIEKVLEVATEVIEKQREPVIITKDRIIEVPHIMEKIVEKIVVMPQVVEVLKYVHEMFDNETVVGQVDVNVSKEAADYKILGDELERGFADFTLELSKVKTMQPSSAQRIAMLEQYLAKFRRFIKYPKIHQIMKNSTAIQPESTRIIKVPAEKSAQDIKHDLAKTIMIEKLASQISRIKRTNPEVALKLDEDIKFILGMSFEGSAHNVDSKFAGKLQDFERSVERQFSKMGGWSADHQYMLKSFLEERFVLANIVKNANSEIKLSKDKSQKLQRELQWANQMIALSYDAMAGSNNLSGSLVKGLNQEDQSLALAFTLVTNKFNDILSQIDNRHNPNFEITNYVDKYMKESWVNSTIRQRQRQIEILVEKLRSGRTRENEHAHCNITIQNLEYEISILKNKLAYEDQDDRYYEQEIKSLKLEVERLNGIYRDSQREVDRLNRMLRDNSNSGDRSHELNLEIRRLNEIILEKDKIIYELKDKIIQIERTYIIDKTSTRSPKESIGTKHTIGSPQRKKESEQYGQNYFEYIQGDSRNAGTLDINEREGFNQVGSFHSGVYEREEGRDLTGSEAATYRSGQVITSSRNTVRGATHTTSSRVIQGSSGNLGQTGISGMNARKTGGTSGGMTQMSGGMTGGMSGGGMTQMSGGMTQMSGGMTGGMSGGMIQGTSGGSSSKKYTYYQKKYEQE